MNDLRSIRESNDPRPSPLTVLVGAVVYGTVCFLVVVGASLLWD